MPEDHSERQQRPKEAKADPFLKSPPAQPLYYMIPLTQQHDEHDYEAIQKTLCIARYTVQQQSSVNTVKTVNSWSQCKAFGMRNIQYNKAIFSLSVVLLCDSALPH